ncbi:MAG: hypothetical protein KDB44_03385 [Mycobacterium sp.]|nr:hypothetical protein [Mycobacterium sp.]
MFSDQAASATQEQRAAVARWQGRDRFYEKVQQAVVGDGHPDAMTVAQQLSDLAQPLPGDVEVWRGIRSIEDTFGTGIDEVEGRADQVARRFMSTSASEQVARGEFLRPGRNPALLKVTARAGIPAVWMPPVGDQRDTHQGELLLAPGFELRIIKIVRSGDIPVIEVEVREP